MHQAISPNTVFGHRKEYKMDEQRVDDSKAYGIWPALCGAIFAALITWLMFHLATGFL